ncbi:MAG: 16S rRNA (cytosine(1402)-N(4))-methyltransferase RsmH [Acidimicrobiales bacterium]
MDATDDSTPFVHDPVMVSDVVALVATVPPGSFVDGTVGGGGHAVAILRSRPDLRIIGIDRDPTALQAAERALTDVGGQFLLRRTRFDRLGPVLQDLGVVELSGALFDLGVSSPQLDRADRGFSFRHDGPLDMRMDPSDPVAADVIVNDVDVDELTRILRRNADERFARRIAEAIVSARPISGTSRLAEVVVAAIPAAARRRGRHPATRTFQAIRIEVNDELAILAPTLESTLDALAVGGRVLVLTYHSGEDRIVKDVFRSRSTSTAPPGLPVAPDEPKFAPLRPLARRPAEAEVRRNPRAASARLRVIERIAA